MVCGIEVIYQIIETGILSVSIVITRAAAIAIVVIVIVIVIVITFIIARDATAVVIIVIVILGVGVHGTVKGFDSRHFIIGGHGRNDMRGTDIDDMRKTPDTVFRILELNGYLAFFELAF